MLPPDASAQLQAEMRTLYGFDRPLPVQFALWLWRALHGDLGSSIATGRPVIEEVSRAVGNTVMLALLAAMIGFAVGLLCGFLAGYFRDTWVDRVVMVLSVVLVFTVTAAPANEMVAAPSRSTVLSAMV